MGTRSITHIHEMKSLDEQEKVVCSFYRHCDGYPSGHGEELADWLKGKNLVNGIGANFREGIDHNRAGQMAIELAHHLKQNTSIEMIPTASDEYCIDYTYHIYFRDGTFYIECKDRNRSITVGANDFDADALERDLYGEDA